MVVLCCIVAETVREWKLNNQRKKGNREKETEKRSRDMIEWSSFRAFSLSDSYQLVDKYPFRCFLLLR